MAEQIRSFWSHLCGIFGAIFGMIAGGTLVTIEKVDAATTTGKAYCGKASEGKYTREVLDNGAVVYTCYGGGWVCAKTSRGGNSYSYDYVFNVAQNFPRFYVAFMGCDDGYYSTENFGLTATTSASSGKILHSIMSSASGAQVVQGYNPYLGKTSTCVYFPGVTFSTSAYYNNGSYENSFFGRPSSDGYTYTPATLTDGKCAKCPSYGEYAAMSTVNSSYAKSVSSCFMSANTLRNDSVDQPDGNATGQFVWTSSCNYDAYEASAPECYAMNGSGDCSVHLTQVANGNLMIPIVKDIVGGSQGAAQSIVNSTNLPASVKSNFSCAAANCYKTVAAERGAGTLLVSKKIDSGELDSGTTGGGTTGGNISGVPRCERMKASGDCSIMLDAAGPNKLTVVKIVQSITGLELKYAKAIVDAAPKMVIKDFSCEAAECYKEIFDANDADVTITEY